MNTRSLKLVALYIVLTAGAVIMVFPIIWTLVSSFKTPAEIMRIPPTFLPQQFTLRNFEQLFETLPFGRYYVNSLIVAITTTLLVLFTSSLGGYLFDKYNFLGKNLFFILILANLMVPFEVLLVPLFRISHSFGLVGNYGGLIIPFLVSPFGLYLMKQFCHEVPNDLIEAARIDGSSEFGTFFRIMLPLMKPALSALSIFNFMGNWNRYLWPLVVINSTRMRTLPVGLAAMQSDFGTRYGLIMAGSTLSIWPVVLLFLVIQRQFIESLALTGLKG